MCTCSSCKELSVCQKCHGHAAELVEGTAQFCHNCISQQEKQRQAQSKQTSYVQCMQGPKLSRMSSKEGSKVARACSSCQESFLRLESHRYRPQDKLVQGLCGTCARLCCRVSNVNRNSTARCALQANSSTRSGTNADARRAKPNCRPGARPKWQASQASKQSVSECTLPAQTAG